jgi:hypothetical protein
VEDEPSKPPAISLKTDCMAAADRIRISAAWPGCAPSSAAAIVAKAATRATIGFAKILKFMDAFPKVELKVHHR